MQQMTDTTRIQPHMPVVCSDGGQFGTVDHLDANNTIKLTKDDQGQHHVICPAELSEPQPGAA